MGMSCTVIKWYVKRPKNTTKFMSQDTKHVPSGRSTNFNTTAFGGRNEAENKRALSFVLKLPGNAVA